MSKVLSYRLEPCSCALHMFQMSHPTEERICFGNIGSTETAMARDAPEPLARALSVNSDRENGQ